MKRLELARIRVCSRCGRGGAELRGADGETIIVVPLDAVRARQLANGAQADDVRPFTDLVLERLGASFTLSEVVLDVSDGRLRALVSLVHGEESEVFACPADEGVALALRGRVRLYATDEALAHATAGAAKPEPETLH